MLKYHNLPSPKGANKHGGPMEGISTVTIEAGGQSVTMTTEEFKAAASPRIKEKEFREVLRCELTKEELDELAGRLAEEQLELQELEE